MKVSTTTSVVGLSQLLSGEESVTVVVVVVSPRQIFDPGCIIDGHGSEAEVWGHAGMVIDCNTIHFPHSHCFTIIWLYFLTEFETGIRRDGHLLFEVEMYLRKGYIMVSGVGSS